MIIPTTSILGNNGAKIYVSIASFRDKELIYTVESLFENAFNPKRIFLSIFSQEDDDDHPDLQPIFDKYGVKDYSYDKISYKNALGAGYARFNTQLRLTQAYRYYLQIDSHTHFSKNWDEKIISDYERLQPVYGKFILSTYPEAYEYEETENGRIVTELDGGIEKVKAIAVDQPHRFQSEYAYEPIGPDGEYTGILCAGLVFGYSKYIMEVPYDPTIYFWGEEQTLSIRFYEKGIKIVCPPRTYLFHDYTGVNRKRHWDDFADFSLNEELSVSRIEDFFNYKINDQFGIKSKGLIESWLSEHIS